MVDISDLTYEQMLTSLSNFEDKSFDIEQRFITLSEEDLEKHYKKLIEIGKSHGTPKIRLFAWIIFKDSIKGFNNNEADLGLGKEDTKFFKSQLLDALKNEDDYKVKKALMGAIAAYVAQLIGEHDRKGDQDDNYGSDGEEGDIADQETQAEEPNLNKKYVDERIKWPELKSLIADWEDSADHGEAKLGMEIIGQMFEHSFQAFFEDELKLIFKNIAKRINDEDLETSLMGIKTLARMCESVDTESVGESLGEASNAVLAFIRERITLCTEYKVIKAMRQLATIFFYDDSKIFRENIPDIAEFFLNIADKSDTIREKALYLISNTIKNKPIELDNVNNLTQNIIDQYLIHLETEIDEKKFDFEKRVDISQFLLIDIDYHSEVIEEFLKAAGFERTFPILQTKMQNMSYSGDWKKKTVLMEFLVHFVETIPEKEPVPIDIFDYIQVCQQDYHFRPRKAGYTLLSYIYAEDNDRPIQEQEFKIVFNILMNGLSDTEDNSLQVQLEAFSRFLYSCPEHLIEKEIENNFMAKVLDVMKYTTNPKIKVGCAGVIRGVCEMTEVDFELTLGFFEEIFKQTKEMKNIYDKIGGLQALSHLFTSLYRNNKSLEVAKDYLKYVNQVISDNNDADYYFYLLWCHRNVAKTFGAQVFDELKPQLERFTQKIDNIRANLDLFPQDNGDDDDDNEGNEGRFTGFDQDLYKNRYVPDEYLSDEEDEEMDKARWELEIKNDEKLKTEAQKIVNGATNYSKDLCNSCLSYAFSAVDQIFNSVRSQELHKEYFEDFRDCLESAAKALKGDEQEKATEALSRIIKRGFEESNDETIQDSAASALTNILYEIDSKVDTSKKDEDGDDVDEGNDDGDDEEPDYHDAQDFFITVGESMSRGLVKKLEKSDLQTYYKKVRFCILESVKAIKEIKEDIKELPENDHAERKDLEDDLNDEDDFLKDIIGSVGSIFNSQVTSLGNNFIKQKAQWINSKLKEIDDLGHKSQTFTFTKLVFMADVNTGLAISNDQPTRELVYKESLKAAYEMIDAENCKERQAAAYLLGQLSIYGPENLVKEDFEQIVKNMIANLERKPKDTDVYHEYDYCHDDTLAALSKILIKHQDHELAGEIAKTTFANYPLVLRDFIWDLDYDIVKTFDFVQNNLKKVVGSDNSGVASLVKGLVNSYGRFTIPSDADGIIKDTLIALKESDQYRSCFEDAVSGLKKKERVNLEIILKN